jgi:hypothetical protein
VTTDPRRRRRERLRQENCGLAARTSCCPSFFPSTSSVHLTRDVFDRMTYLSTSPLVSHPTKPTPFYPLMHACVAGLCAVHASIFFQNTSDHGGHAFCCSRDMPTSCSMLCLLEPLRSLCLVEVADHSAKTLAPRCLTKPKSPSPTSCSVCRPLSRVIFCRCPHNARRCLAVRLAHA